MDRESILIRLIRTRDFLIEHGWAQETWCSKDGICLGQSMMMAVTNNSSPLESRILQTPAQGRELMELQGALGFASNLQKFNVIPRWNDEEGRTIEDVFELLNKAIENYSSDDGDTIISGGEIAEVAVAA